MKISDTIGWLDVKLVRKATSRRSTRAMDAACKLFFARRGLGELCDWQQAKKKCPLEARQPSALS